MKQGMRDLFVEVDIEAIKRETLPPFPERMSEWSQEHVEFFVAMYGVDCLRDRLFREMRAQRVI